MNQTESGSRQRSLGRRTCRWCCYGWIIAWLATSCGLPAVEFQEVCGFPSLPNPIFGLVQAGDGAFYGVTSGGGEYGYGSVFRVTTNGVMSTIAWFACTNGANPLGPLALGEDGALYGVTECGGTNDMGTAFRVSTNGVLTVLVHFSLGLADSAGCYPFTALVKGADGGFYGEGGGGFYRITKDGILARVGPFVGAAGSGYIKGRDNAFYVATASGGANGTGSVMRVTTNGLVTTVASFPGTNWLYPSGPLAEAPDGSLYGTTVYGGIADAGTVYRVTPDGELTILSEFNWEESDGGWPMGGLRFSNDGLLYGTTWAGGEQGYGTVFRVTTNGALTTLWSFDGVLGGFTDAPLAKATDGAFLGVTEVGGDNNVGTVFRVGVDGRLARLASFTSESEGANPQTSLLLASDGAFYGTTPNGGSNNCGTVFRVTTNEATSLLAVFSTSSSAGFCPQGKLIQASDGVLYGTTSAGGAGGGGTVFRLTTGGTLTTLASFGSTNGCVPIAGLVEGSDGAFYGTTSAGGGNGFGTVFRVTTNGLLTVLTSFAGTNGAYPDSDLVFGADGRLYGTTPGWSDSSELTTDYGTVFRVTTNGDLVSLASFALTGGAFSGGLTLGYDGALYGATQQGGSNYCGTIFRITTNGESKTLFEFSAFASYGYGRYPRGSLLPIADGSVYGTTTQDGRNDCGCVFVLQTNGTIAELASFARPTGIYPRGGLTLGPDGALYGTTTEGGSRGGGNVFRVALPSPPEPPRLRILDLRFPWAGMFADISFTGPAGAACRLLRSTNLSGPWELIGTATIRTNSVERHADYTWPRGGAFYRIVSP